MIRLGGLTPLTTIDFPGRLAAVLYLQGCPWRCSYCHNPALLPASGGGHLDWSAALAFLQRRRGLLDGVVLSGGEPTAQANLAAAVERLKALGFHIGLHTGGMYPARLRQVLPQLDWVGLDIKAPWAGYDAVTGRRGSGRAVEASLQCVLDSGVAYECRTTWSAGLFPVEDLYALGEHLAARGVTHWALQQRRLKGEAWTPPLQAQVDLARLGVGFEVFTVRAT